MAQKLFIFDADGTLRADCGGRPPLHPSEQVVLPGVREKLSSIDWGQDALFAIASNQASVGRGLVTAELAHQMLFDLAAEVTGFCHAGEAIRLCPHLPDEGCQCRKPRPGMLLELKAFFGVKTAVFIGDAETDRLAATRAGIEFVWAEDYFDG